MKFKLTPTSLNLYEYLNEIDQTIDPNGYLLNMLNEHFKGWVLILNRNTADLNCICHVNEYFNNRNEIYLDVDMYFYKKDILELIIDNEDIKIDKNDSADTSLLHTDIIYLLEINDKISNNVEKIKWWKNGKFIKEYNEYNDILNIIDANIEKSKKFGLVINQDDIDYEKKVIFSIFSEHKFKKWSEYTDNEYTALYNKLYNEISNKLESQLKYYFYNTPPGETKNRYNCHLNIVVSDLMRNMIINEATKWYSKGKFTPDENNKEQVTEYNDFITDDKFRQFLIDNDCYEQYINNCNNPVCYHMRPSHWKNFKRGDYINLAFTWSCTPEPDYFWFNLHKKWENHIKLNKLDESIKWYSKGKFTPDESEQTVAHGDFITDDEFRQFLIDNDCYDQYIDNSMNPEFANNDYGYGKLFKNDILPPGYISYAFTWMHTKQGHEYWKKLNKKWKDQIDH